MEEFKKYKSKPQLDEYEFIIDDNDIIDGVRFVSVVDNPAIRVSGVYFNDENKEESYKFKEINTEKGILAGPIMIPDIRICREDKIRGKFNGFFSKDTIERIVYRWSKNNFNNNINFNHTDKMANGVLIEYWLISDPTFDKSRIYGFNLPIGTWFGLVKFDDMEFFQDVVKNGFSSFSVEVNASLKANFSEEIMSYEDEIMEFLLDNEEIVLDIIKNN